MFFILHSSHALTGLQLDCTADLYTASLLLSPATLSIADERSSFLLRHCLCPSRPFMSSAVCPGSIPRVSFLLFLSLNPQHGFIFQLAPNTTFVYLLFNWAFIHNALLFPNVRVYVQLVRVLYLPTTSPIKAESHGL